MNRLIINRSTLTTLFSIFTIVLVWFAVVFVSSLDDYKQAAVAGEMISRNEIYQSDNPINLQ